MVGGEISEGGGYSAGFVDRQDGLAVQLQRVGGG